MAVWGTSVCDVEDALCGRAWRGRLWPGDLLYLPAACPPLAAHCHVPSAGQAVLSVGGLCVCL